jgi:hypothetical protein
VDAPALRLPKSRIALRVARAVLVTAGRALLPRAAALFAAVGVIATILFAGQGLRAVDVVRLHNESLGVRAALWLGWTLLALPAIAPTLDAPGTRTLRTLRLPQAALLVSLALLFAFVEIPWAILFARGGGPASALASTALHVALQASILATRVRLRSVGLVMAALALVAWNPPVPWLVIPAALLAAVAVRAAWRHAVDRPRANLRILRPMPALLALTIQHGLRLTRTERPRLAMGALASAIFAGFLFFSLRNDPTVSPWSRAVAVMVLPSTLVAALLATPLLDAERRLQPWLRSLQVRARIVVFAFLLAMGTPTSVFAASTSAISSAAAEASPLSVAAAVGAAAWVVAALLSAWARLHQRTRRKNPIVFALGVIAIAAFAIGGAEAC